MNVFYRIKNSVNEVMSQARDNSHTTRIPGMPNPKIWVPFFGMLAVLFSVALFGTPFDVNEEQIADLPQKDEASSDRLVKSSEGVGITQKDTSVARDYEHPEILNLLRDHERLLYAHPGSAALIHPQKYLLTSVNNGSVYFMLQKDSEIGHLHAQVFVDGEKVEDEQDPFKIQWHSRIKPNSLVLIRWEIQNVLEKNRPQLNVRISMEGLMPLNPRRFDNHLVQDMLAQD